MNFTDTHVDMRSCQFLFYIIIFLNAQSQITGRQYAENKILQMLADDTSSNVTIYLNPSLRFGFEWNGTAYLIAAKEKSRTYLIHSGSQKVYELTSDADGSEKLVRLDSSTHFGDNYNCMGFLYHDTLYQYGGYGFWENRDFFTRFSKKSAEWEFVQGGDKLENTLLLSYLDRKNGHFYVFGQHEQETSKDFNPVFNDSIFRYDMNKKTWISLGKINPLIDPFNYKKTLMYNSSFETPFGLGVVSLNGELEIIDFLNNKVVPIKRNLKDSILGKFRNANASLSTPQISYLYLSNQLHYIVFNESKCNISTVLFDSSALENSKSIPLYISKDRKLNSDGIQMWASIFLFIIMLVFIIFLYLKKSQSTQNSVMNSIRKMPAIHEAPHNIDFVSTFSAVEIELLKELIHYADQNKKMSTEIINRILGVSNKDNESQKGRRSQVITRINQVYGTYTKNSSALILRERDEKDKRAYLYFIAKEQQKYLKDILKIKSES